MTEYFATHPLFLVVAGIVFVMLVILTMRSIIRRDKAMVGPAADPAKQAAAYENQWRKSA